MPTDPIEHIRGPRIEGTQQARKSLDHEVLQGLIKFEERDFPSSKRQENIKATFVSSPEPSPESTKLPPLVFFIHSGLMMGSDQNTGLPLWGALLVQAFGALVVSPDYKRAPDNEPEGLSQDCYDVLLQVSKEGKFDHDNTILFGLSAGGGIAVCTLLRIIAENKITKPRGVFLEAPMLDPMCDSESMMRWYDESHFLFGGEIKFAWNGTLKGETSKFAVPKHATPEDIAEFPATFVMVCGADPLHDEGVKFAQRRLDFKLLDLEGVPHGGYAILPYAESSLKYVFQMLNWIQALGIELQTWVDKGDSLASFYLAKYRIHHSQTPSIETSEDSSTDPITFS